MSLYDDEDLKAPLTEVAKGWSTGIKMMQSHLQAKKLAPSSMGPPKSGFKDPITRNRTLSAPVLAPVIDLKSKKHIVEDPLTKSESRVCYPTVYLRLQSSAQIIITLLMYLFAYKRNLVKMQMPELSRR